MGADEVRCYSDDEVMQMEKSELMFKEKQVVDQERMTTGAVLRWGRGTCPQIHLLPLPTFKS